MATADAQADDPGAGDAAPARRPEAISREHYPDLAVFWDDVAAAYRAAIAHIAAAGCTYLQLDDVSFSYLCDPNVRDGLRASGDDPAALPRAYAAAINRRSPAAPPA